MKLGIIDYQAGNLFSLQTTVKKLTESVVVSSDPERLVDCDCLILPGVGSFNYGMNKLIEFGLDDFIHTIVDAGKPLLGICLGMQLMHEASEEGEAIAGLGLVTGQIQAMSANTEARIPHVGWNNLKQIDFLHSTQGIAMSRDFYFVHSYASTSDDPSFNKAICCHGKNRFNAILERDNIWGVQFHPEKSQDSGKALLKNFLRLANA